MTYIPNTIIEKARMAKIFHQMASMEGKSPMEMLVKMQTERGIDEAAARANATACLTAVAGREAVYEALSEDANATMDRFFEVLAEKEDAQRLEALQRILFGLTLHTNPGAPGFGGDVEQMFQSWQAGENGTPEELEDKIRQALTQYRIHPAALKMLAHKLKNTDGCMATAAALGESGRNLKCLMTMDLWLENQDTMTMGEAANVACTSADYQAVADAVNKGYIARDVAKKILKVIAIAALVVGIFYLAFSTLAVLSGESMLVSMAADIAALPESALAANPAIMDAFLESAWAYDAILAGVPHIMSEGFLYCLLGGAVTALSGWATKLVGSATSWVAGLFQKAEETNPDTLSDLDSEEEAEVIHAPVAPVQDPASTLSDSILFHQEEEDEDEDEDSDLLGI